MNEQRAEKILGPSLSVTWVEVKDLPEPVPEPENFCLPVHYLEEERRLTELQRPFLEEVVRKRKKREAEKRRLADDSCK